MSIMKLILTAAICVFLFPSCKADTSVKETEYSTEIIIPDEITETEIPTDETSYETEAHTSVTQTSEAVTETTYDPIAAPFIEKLETKTGEKVIWYDCDDYDGNGTPEMFAALKTCDTDSLSVDEVNNNIFCNSKSWYYVSNDEITLVSDEYSYIIDFIRSDDKRFLVLQPCSNCMPCNVYGVKDNTFYKDSISGNGMSFTQNEYGELVLTQSAYDGSTYGDGEEFSPHTWKDYWFYYEDGSFHEYGGIEITEDELSQYVNSNRIFDEVSDVDGEITSILYRVNGIVNVNFSVPYYGTENGIQVLYCYRQYYITAKLEKDTLNVRETDKEEYKNSGDGRYSPALAPEIAVYPTF